MRLLITVYIFDIFWFNIHKSGLTKRGTVKEWSYITSAFSNISKFLNI